MTKPAISVVIPFYNDGAYLKETLDRLSEQTFRDFETIIVNDGSTDAASLQILKTIEEQGRAKVIHQSNQRMSAARNTGVRHAQADVIVALDADDYFDPSFFAKGLAILDRQPQTAVVTSYIQMFGTIKKLSKPRGGGEKNFLFSNQCPAVAMVRKNCWESIGGYDENMRYGYEDWEFYIRITQRGWNVHVIEEKLLYYRQTSKSTHKNDTLTHRAEIVDYIVDKHSEWYLRNLKSLITEEKVLYADARIAYPVILRLLLRRLKGKFES